MDTQEVNPQTTRVVNMHVHPGTPDDVYIGRGSRWGNPFSVYYYGREKAIELYRRLLWEKIKDGDVSLQNLADLDGKYLVCYCAPKACHGDVLARAAAWAKTQLPQVDWRYVEAVEAERDRLRAALDRLEAERDATQARDHAALLRAARVRVEYGHNDTFDSQLGMLAPEIRCSCGHDALLAALDAMGGHQ